MNPALVLTMILDLYAQLAAAQQENAELRARITSGDTKGED